MNKILLLIRNITFRKIRNWVWKHFFPRSWNRLEERVREQMTKLSNQMDHFLAYGDQVPFFQPSDDIYSFDPAKIEAAYRPEGQGEDIFVAATVTRCHDIENNSAPFQAEVNQTPPPPVLFDWNNVPTILGYPLDKLGFIKTGAEVSEEEYKKLFTPEQTEAIQRELKGRIAAARLGEGLPISISMDMLNKWQKPVFIAGPGSEIDENFCEEPGDISIDERKLFAWQKIMIEKNAGNNLEFCTRARSPGRYTEYIEFLKQDISAGMGIPVDQLFTRRSGMTREQLILLEQRLVEEEFLKFEQEKIAAQLREMLEVISKPVADITNVMFKAISPSIRLFETNEAGDFLNKMNHVAEAQPYDLSKWVVKKDGSKIPWAKYFEEQKKEALAASKKRKLQAYLDGYLMGKAESYSKKAKLYECYGDSCNEELDFNGFVSVNPPHTYIEYYDLKRIWVSKHIVLYCCDCFGSAEIKEKERLKL